MQTVLLADDERVFKAIEGTCLRREVCRLVKAPLADIAAAASRERPDLIVLALDGDAAHRALRELTAAEGLSTVPIIAIDAGGADVEPRAGGAAGQRKAPVEVIPARRRGSPASGAAELDARLDAAIKRHMPIFDRRIDRVSISVPVRCRVEGAAFTVRTKDLSPSGLFLKTDRPMAPGDTIRVRFDLPPETGTKDRATIAATCLVVRRVGAGGQDDEDLIPGLGVRFLDLEEDGRLALRRLLGRRPAAGAGSRARGAHV